MALIHWTPCPVMINTDVEIAHNVILHNFYHAHVHVMTVMTRQAEHGLLRTLCSFEVYIMITDYMKTICCFEECTTVYGRHENI